MDGWRQEGVNQTPREGNYQERKYIDVDNKETNIRGEYSNIWKKLQG